MNIITDKKLLRRKSETVIDTDNIDDVLNELVNYTEQHDDCLGIAAVQVGILKRVSYLSFKDERIKLVNPEIIDHSVNHVGEEGWIIYPQEGCVSFPRKFIDTKRYKWVLVRDDINGEKKYKGTKAVAVQHEIDHMDGVLFMDRRLDVPKKREHQKIGRNQKCLCGSGIKYKKCCGK